MSSPTISCSICYEPFVRSINPPMSLVPCGHVVCRPCLDQWNRSSSSNRSTCVFCRQRVTQTIQNYALMDLLESTQQDQQQGQGVVVNNNGGSSSSSDNINQQNQNFNADTPQLPRRWSQVGLPEAAITEQQNRENRLANSTNGNIDSSIRLSTSMTGSSRSNRLFELPDGSRISPGPSNTLMNSKPNQGACHEMLPDRTVAAYYVIDNSGSMAAVDGKRFEFDRHQNKLLKKGWGQITRWEEACFKTLQIAIYNIRRKMRATYFLLNPMRGGQWIANQDQVVIDPGQLDLNLLNIRVKEWLRQNQPGSVSAQTPTGSMSMGMAGSQYQVDQTNMNYQQQQEQVTQQQTFDAQGLPIGFQNGIARAKNPTDYITLQHPDVTTQEEDGVLLFQRLLAFITHHRNQQIGVFQLCEILNESCIYNPDSYMSNPSNSDVLPLAQALRALYSQVLGQGNVRGSTPLDIITSFLQQQIQEELQMQRAIRESSAGQSQSSQQYGSTNTPIIYNIITDGEPNNKRNFEQRLRQLCSGNLNEYSVFLVINLCTDQDEVVEYYNDLDKCLGNEVSGLDVLDDLESEQKEI